MDRARGDQDPNDPPQPLIRPTESVTEFPRRRRPLTSQCDHQWEPSVETLLENRRAVTRPRSQWDALEVTESCRGKSVSEIVVDT